MNIIYKCYVVLFSEEYKTHIRNSNSIYYKIIVTKFNEMCVKLKTIKTHLIFDIYLTP